VYPGPKNRSQVPVSGSLSPGITLAGTSVSPAGDPGATSVTGAGGLQVVLAAVPAGDRTAGDDTRVVGVPRLLQALEVSRRDVEGRRAKAPDRLPGQFA
jgi:hypothetical protein